MTVEKRNIEIPVDNNIVLQGVLSEQSADQGAVLCHPHPLYGGTMNNNVLFAAEEALHSCHMSTLRFNFRGVGQSTGQHGGGIEEAKDVVAACAYMRNETGGTGVHVVAYSFGAYAFLHASKGGLAVESCVLVAPPISAMDFSNLTLPNCHTSIIVGDCDSYCAQSDLRNWLNQTARPDTGLTETVLANTDHFFVGSEDRLIQVFVELFGRT